MILPEIDDLKRLFLDDIAMMDMRAPVEFAQGAFPGVVNLPLMNNDERQKVGLCYKECGQDKAIELGHALVSGDVKAARVSAWRKFVIQNPEGALYCFRGGLRSKISQQWIYENTGIAYPRVKGGYKAMRRFLLDELETSSKEIQLVIISGRTGIGKTLLLGCLQDKVDLEGIFRHRGSVFGKHADPQPSQIDIENMLSIQLLKKRYKNISNIVVEDESVSIGSRRIPDVFFNKMKQAPLIMLEASTQERVDITFNEYIHESLAEHQKMFGEEAGFYQWAESLKKSLDKIQRRLGGVRYQKYKKTMDEAIRRQRDFDDRSLHKVWIQDLLTQYYDPMYDYQLSKKKHRKVFQGDRAAVLSYLADEYQIG